MKQHAHPIVNAPSNLRRGPLAHEPEWLREDPYDFTEDRPGYGSLVAEIIVFLGIVVVVLALSVIGWTP